MDNPTEVLNRSRTGRRHYFAVLFLLALTGALLWVGYRPWKQRQDALLAAAKEDGERAVVVTAVKVRRASGSIELVLPGTISAMSETPIYARSEGYIVARKVDIGDHVKAGQLLVEIDTPELDDQVRQAVARVAQARAAIAQSKAFLAQAQANLKMADTHLKRTDQLVKEGILSKQEGDDRRDTYAARLADIDAARAAQNAAEESLRASESEVARLTNLTSFKKVAAPFDGIITARTCEVGNLINSSALASGRELFRLADIQTARITLNVPEPSAPAIQQGLAASVAPQAFPGQTFMGKVVRTANSLDPANRTLLTEVHVPNPGGKLMPGMYAQVKVLAGSGGPAVLVSGDTITVRSDGAYVATVQADSTVHFKKVAIGRDYGAEVAISAGLNGDELLVVNPGDNVREGVKVTPVVGKAK